MKAQLSNHDYEQLSAYIDGQLTPAERHKLEERLRVQTELQAALDELSRTRTLLRTAPRRRAPRNFTITPAMVGVRAGQRRGPWWNLFPVLSFTSAVATLALVASFVFQLLPGGAVPKTVAMQPQADRVAIIVEQTMTAMQAATPANLNDAAPQAQKAAPAAESQAKLAVAPTQEAAGSAATEEVQRSIAPAAPTATPEMPAMTENVQNTPAEGNPPIITWNGNTAPPGASGYGGGGGSGQGPGIGPLLGPPESPSADTPLGKGGGGDLSGQGGTIVIPTQGVNTPENSATPTAQPSVEPTTEPAAGAAAPAIEAPAASAEASATAPATELAMAPTEAAPAQVNPEISGSGPILGVPSPGEGGQIVDKKAILGQPEAGSRNSSKPGQPQPGAEPNGLFEQRARSGSQTLFGFPFLAVIQALLVIIAVGTGVAAYLVRRQAK